METRKRVASAILILSFLVASSGCSVFMAARQPDYKNVNVLSKGTPRSKVVAELGAPVLTETDAGKKKDIFAFKQGYSTGNKVSRVLFHAAADVFTWGLWEVVGTPAEAIASGRNIKVEIIYDKDDMVEQVKYMDAKTQKATEKEIAQAETKRYKAEETPREKSQPAAFPEQKTFAGSAPGQVSSSRASQATSTFMEYQQYLYKTIASAVVKPKASAAGTVKVAFTLRSTGAVESIKFLEGSSENSFLKIAVAQAINNSSPFPPFPNDMKNESSKTFTMEIEFK